MEKLLAAEARKANRLENDQSRRMAQEFEEYLWVAEGVRFPVVPEFYRDD